MAEAIAISFIDLHVVTIESRVSIKEKEYNKNAGEKG